MTKIKFKPRKLQSIGYSFFVSLPIVWVANSGLKKGALVELEMDCNGDLRLRGDIDGETQ